MSELFPIFKPTNLTIAPNNLMSSPLNNPMKDVNWESVHICPQCGHVLNLDEIDLKAITTGIVQCPNCDWEGPIQIQVTEMNG